MTTVEEATDEIMEAAGEDKMIRDITIGQYYPAEVRDTQIGSKSKAGGNTVFI